VEVDNLQSVEVDKPSNPKKDDVLVKVLACSVNPVDNKIRMGGYDDDPEYYERCPCLPHIIGFEGAGVVEAVGPECKLGFKQGDEVYFFCSPFRHGSNAEYVVVKETGVAFKPKSLGFAEAAGIPLTAVTAWEVLFDRLEIKKGENCGIVIVNGAGGVGSIASQLARRVLELPVVITTASRPETKEFSLKVGQATHVINHHEDIAKQIKDLKLTVPIKYFFISHTPTDHYAKVAAEVLAPFGKICSIVQGKFEMYGTPAMAKSLSYIWCWAATKVYCGLEDQLIEYHNLLNEVTKYIDQKNINHHITVKLPFTVKGLRKGHQMIKDSVAIGKVVFSTDVQEGGGVQQCM